MKNQTYHEDLIGKACLVLFKLHRDKSICYQLNEEAKELYEEIFEQVQ